MKTKELPSTEYLYECFTPDFELGILTWNVRPLSHFIDEWRMKIWNAKFPGTKAGTLGMLGYYTVQINKSPHKIHRIIWKMHKGIDPPNYIDHIDLNRSNNTISNLREATASNNRCNVTLRSDNTSGHKGIHWHKITKQWLVSVKCGDLGGYVGIYKNLDDAITARNQAQLQYHGEFTNNG